MCVIQYVKQYVYKIDQKVKHTVGFVSQKNIMPSGRATILEDMTTASMFFFFNINIVNKHKW